MKKIVAFALAFLGTMSLTGCDVIQGFISGEKSYNYNDFKALLADRKLSFTNTKAVAKIDKDGNESTREYNYDADDKAWKYKYKTTILGEEIEMDGSAQLDVINDAKSCELAAALVKKKTDELFKFYAKNDSYRITADYKTDDEQIKFEYKYRADGLIDEKYEKNTNLKSITSTETKTKFTYSD